ncbi:MAG TPA: hypothetical protein VFK84_07505, partial [Burkholderiales bacterium]|nr:hypothetical protein [Burkholderiales bacterium]
MHSELNAQLAFHLTGLRSAEAVAPLDGLALRPALLAGLRDLHALRYDFPLVLAEDAADGEFARPLSALVDQALAGVSDERIRAHALRREKEIRAGLGASPARELAALWNVAPKLAANGVLADCDASFPARFLHAAWTSVHAAKSRRFHDEADRLKQQLADIVAADFVHSDEGRTAQRLEPTLGADFDTQALSRLLATALPERRLPRTRRRRLRALLSTLMSQRFFPGERAGAKTYGYVFYSCAAALQALRERRIATLELAKAMAAARLEARGEYVEALHDPLFGELGEAAVDPALVPDYLVCLNARNLNIAAEASGLAELLASGMPVKILVQHDDILSSTMGRLSYAAQARLVAGMALGLNDVFVVQAAASHLYPVRNPVRKALEYPGVALFNVFSGANASGAAPYLVAAAAAESRAFPTFSYDPAAGFSLDGNPQPEAGWPRHELAYEDAEHQAQRETLEFTFMDFAAGDARYASHFAVVDKVGEGVPSLRMVDSDNRLKRVIVSEPLVRESDKCLAAWRALQARVTPVAPAPQPQPVAEVPKPVEAPPAAEKAAPATDAPYIETPRCTTCEECVKINNRLFVYNADKQASIADPKLGTYKELVEAAEL